MASGGDDEFEYDDFGSREPLTPRYNPASDDTAGAKRGGRTGGPLSARISQRRRDSQPPASGEPAYTHFTRSPYEQYQQPAPQEGPVSSVGGYAPASPGGYAPAAPRPAPSWERVTGVLRLDDKVTGTLHSGLQFGATWSSRAEMLRGCLDEYYRLVASFNETRRLLELSDADIDALRREQAASAARLREVEARLEFQSRVELRAVYLGAAEIETRLFRAEEERSLLSSRAELLEGFMMFLSRIIATVRAMPESALGNGANGANGSAPDKPSAPASLAGLSGMNPQETLIYDGSRGRPAGAAQVGKDAKGLDIEEYIVDERDVSLLASSEFEIIEILEEDPTQLGADALSAKFARAAGAAASDGSAATPATEKREAADSPGPQDSTDTPA
jgi:hypothetical protein